MKKKMEKVIHENLQDVSPKKIIYDEHRHSFGEQK